MSLYMLPMMVVTFDARQKSKHIMNYPFVAVPLAAVVPEGKQLLASLILKSAAVVHEWID